MTSDGKPYGPWRYKQIVKECYIISKNINTNYLDLMEITPRERSYMLEFLKEEFDKTNEEIEKAKQKVKDK